MPHCTTCGKNQNYCGVCSFNNFLVAGKCVACAVANCSVCTNNQNTCSTCAPNYFVDNRKCVTC